jgi:DNA mismatch repair protein MutH
LNSAISINPPTTEKELLENTAQIIGLSLQQLANSLAIEVPANQLKAKGWVGELMEARLGATASSRPEPDFQNIGVELKTLPLDLHGKPKESTYVSTVPLRDNIGQTWEQSVVKLKLNRVLWVPVEADPSIVLSQRRIGKSFIWSPNQKEENDLRADWQELIDMITMGELHKINARQGKYLQIRPKAANAKALSRTTLQTGESGLTLPRGFYLRPAFTRMLLAQYLS